MDIEIATDGNQPTPDFDPTTTVEPPQDAGPPVATGSNPSTDAEPVPPPRLEHPVTVPVPRPPRTGGRGLAGRPTRPSTPATAAGPSSSARGSVIAINTAVATGAEGLGFAIPISAAADLIQLARSGATA